jgi:hypothetical protein
VRRSGTNGEVERRGGPISVSDGWGKGALAEAPFPGGSRVGPAWGRLAGNAAYLDSLGGVFKHLEAFWSCFRRACPIACSRLLAKLSNRRSAIPPLRVSIPGRAPRNDSRILASLATRGTKRINEFDEGRKRPFLELAAKCEENP